MTNAKRFYKKMLAVGKVLSHDPERKDRYANATKRSEKNLSAPLQAVGGMW